MGSGTPHPSAALELQATDKAFYPPKLTTIQRKAIVNPQSGAFVYDLDKGTFYLYDGVNWLPMVFNAANSTPSIDRTASDGVQGDNFGISVAISGDYAVVGSPNASVNGNTLQGAAYVFVRTGNTWKQDIKLTASDGVAGDRFGVSVAISNEYAIIGSDLDNIGANTKQGSAYVIVRSGSSWAQQAKLTAVGGTANNQFGFDVAISGSNALVGSLGGGANLSQGAAFVFVRSGSSWNQQAKLTAADGEDGDGFGRKVAIFGDYAILGSVFDRVGDNIGQGSAYLYKRSGANWTQVRKITDNSSANTKNGASVGISNGTFIIGGFGFHNFQGKVGFGTVDN